MSKQRLPLLDVIRGIAIIMMIVFHFAWNLQVFGFVSRDTLMTPGWSALGDVTLFLFLSISGFCMIWFWRDRFTWQGVKRRFIKVGLAALAVTIVTLIIYPNAFVYFGVLHHIALGSVLLAVFRKLSTFHLVAAALLFGLAPMWFASSFFNPPFWWWTGLNVYKAGSQDYVPLAPYYWMMLAGAVAAKTAPRKRTTAILSKDLAPLKPLAWAGRHSLAIYLIHQPILWGGVWLCWRCLAPSS